MGVSIAFYNCKKYSQSLGALLNNGTSYFTGDLALNTYNVFYHYCVSWYHPLKMLSVGSQPNSDTEDYLFKTFLEYHHHWFLNLNHTKPGENFSSGFMWSVRSRFVTDGLVQRYVLLRSVKCCDWISQPYTMFTVWKI